MEYGAFSIDWSYPPKVLVKEFAQWVDRQIKERREGKSAEEPSVKGVENYKQVGFIESDELAPTTATAIQKTEEARRLSRYG